MSLHDLVPWNWGGKSVPVKTRGRRKPGDHFAEFFNDFWSGFAPDSFRMTDDEQQFVPKVNVKDTQSAILVSAEVPGIEESDLDITLNADSLVIKGEKNFSHEEKEEEGYHYVEQRYGSFQRTVPLGVDIDEDGVRAKFKNGVLTVTLPKASEHVRKTRKISVG